MITSISDIPCNPEVNDFGTESYVKGLIKFIKSSTTPITIALQGEWGSGKTSLMLRLERELCSGEAAPFKGISINTWEYAMISTPQRTVLDIISSLLKTLGNGNENSSHKFDSFIRSAVNSLYRGVREGVKTLPVVGGGIAVGLEALNVPTKILDDRSENTEERISISELRITLEESVERTIKESGKKGIIIFVDDLDRLNPEVAVEVLELLKNIFCIKGCVFILAIDYEVVIKGLKPKFGELTEKNAREFRSFFDKIIQVPFSLPVNSYHPMDFVLDSLANIGFITQVEKSDPRLREPFTKIIQTSVGKNPRSIKRLINTLSLITCINQCSTSDDSVFPDSLKRRIVNFAVVALQVCYPKIYNMLAVAPNFTTWDGSLAERFNLQISYTDSDDAAPAWEDLLDAACKPDSYLSQRQSDIRSLLLLMSETIDDDANFESKMRSVIDKSSVTGVDMPAEVGVVDFKRLMNTVHWKMLSSISKKRPEIAKSIKFKRNTGNGGVYISMPKGETADISFRTGKDKRGIYLRLDLHTSHSHFGEFRGMTWSQIMQDGQVRKAIEDFDSVVAPLIDSKVPYFSVPGEPHEKYSRQMESWYDPNRDLFIYNTAYDIILKNESQFADEAIINTISDIVIANYDMRNALDQRFPYPHA